LRTKTSIVMANNVINDKAH